MVIGTFAYCGSGQDTLANGFCRYKGFQKYSLGDVIRDIASKRNLPHRRETLQRIREECDLRHGRYFVPEQLTKKIESEMPNNIIITGIRTREEYLYFKKKFNMVLVFVFADEKIRYQRMIARADIKDETDHVELKNRMIKEESLFDYKELENCADLLYNFNSNLEDYLREEEETITYLMEQLLLLK